MVVGKSLPNLSTVQIAIGVCHVRMTGWFCKKDCRFLRYAGLRLFLEKYVEILCINSLFVLYGMC